MIVEPDFLTHWKTQMLINELSDPAAPLYLIALWAHCQMRRSDRIEGITAEGMKAICRYQGEAEKLWSVLLACGWIALEGNTVVVVGWAETNAKLIANWTNGSRGGRPKKTHAKPTGSPPEAHRKPTGSPPETQPKPTQNPPETQPEPTQNPTRTQPEPNQNPPETEKRREEKRREEGDKSPLPPFLPSAEPPAGTRAAKPAAKPKAEDPRHHAITSQIKARFRSVTGREMSFDGGRDAKALQRFLAGWAGAEADFWAVAEQAWRHAMRDRFARFCKQSGSLAGLCQHWSAIEAELAAANVLQLRNTAPIATDKQPWE